MIKIGSLLVWLLLINGILFAQQHELRTKSSRAIRNYENGLTSYKMQNYLVAEQDFKEAIRIDSGFQNAYLVLAEVFWDEGKYKDAIHYYDEGLSLDPTFYPQGYLNKGHLEIKIGEYAGAAKSYETYLGLDTTEDKYTKEARRGLKQAKFALYEVAHPVEFKPINLGPNVNSRYDDYWPSLSADGQKLVITRMVPEINGRGTHGFQEDFFYSILGPNGWSNMKEMGPPLNTPDNEGAQSISANGRLMVYTVCNRPGVIGRCDIYYSERENEAWSFPKNMGPPINTSAKETQPSLSADGRTIYFSSDRPGGKGKLDLWMSTRNDDGTWSNPVNLGDSINTPGNEMSPFIHQDNNTLYFSSDYLLGMGGFDIFMAKRDKNGNWTHVKNLGYPINTCGDEVGLIVNAAGNTAYYASDMDKEDGKDIYKFELYKGARPAEVSYMKGTVFDEKTRKRLKANFELYDLSNGKLVSQSYSDGATGEFLVCIPTDRNYMLNVDRKGYLFYSDNFELKGVFHLEHPFLKDIPMKPISAGESVVLKNIFYETDSYALKDESKYELDKVVKFLQANPGVHIQISGHTDNTGTESHNMTLSTNRAKSVVTYLTAHGIEANRLSYKGYGYSKPVDTNETPEGRAKNRRTELKVVSN